MTEDSRIPEIRSAIADFERYGTNGPRTPGQMLRDVLDILDRPAPTPRVFLPGDHIPSDLVVVAEHGIVYAYDAPETTWDEIGGPVVEVPLPSPEEWQAAIDQAHAVQG